MYLRMRKLLTACLLSLAGTAHAQSYKELVTRGLHLMEVDSLSAAEASFRQAMLQEPGQKSNALLYRHIGEIQECQGKMHEALESYTTGINLSPSTESLLMHRASLYLRLGNDEQAIADYGKILELSKDNKEALFFRAWLYAKRRDYKGARADYDHLLQLDPVHEEALQGLAILNTKDGRPREAMEQLNNLVLFFPDHAVNYVLRGGVHQDRKNYELALFDFNKAIELEPQNPEHYISRASCYIGMKRKKQARKDLNDAALLNGDRRVIAELMAQMK